MKPLSSVRFSSFSLLSSSCYYVSCLIFWSRYECSSSVCSGDKVETFPVLKIDSKDIVDTTGAGDAFVGGKSFPCVYLIYF